MTVKGAAYQVKTVFLLKMLIKWVATLAHLLRFFN